MLNDDISSGLRAHAREFLQDIWESPLSVGKVREPKRMPVFALLLDTAGRIVFQCIALEAGYKTMRGHASPYAFPTEKGWEGMEKAERDAVKKAGEPPFILLFLDCEGVIEHLRLNPTGALLWSVRFWGWNEIQPHQGPFDSAYDVWLF